jgi:hypothetical protein
METSVADDGNALANRLRRLLIIGFAPILASDAPAAVVAMVHDEVAEDMEERSAN